MITNAEVAARIERAVSERAGFSFLRLGDGEGALLSANDRTLPALRPYFRKHFGNAITDAQILEIRANLISAIDNADLLGVRDDVLHAPAEADALDPADPQFMAGFTESFPLRRSEQAPTRDDAVRILELYHWFRARPADGADICSQWVCYDLAFEQFWNRLLSRVDSIGLVHCSRTLPVKIRDMFGIEVESLLVPEKAIHMTHFEKLKALLVDVNHYPRAFRAVSRQLERPLDGKLFFVGAGLVGKKYLEIIKRNGGVAIDVGALLDAWDGRPTRPHVYRDKVPDWNDPNQPPEVFQLRRLAA